MSYETSPEFTAYCRRLELEALEARLAHAMEYLHSGDDRQGYGLSAVGVTTLIEILRGECDCIQG